MNMRCIVSLWRRACVASATVFAIAFLVCVPAESSIIQVPAFSTPQFANLDADSEQDRSVNLHFDLAALLSPSISPPYSVTAASLSLLFGANGSTVDFVNQTRTLISSDDTADTYKVVDYYTNPLEAATVTVGNQTFTGSTPYYSLEGPAGFGFDTVTIYDDNGLPIGTRNEFYQYYRNESGYRGEFTIMESLSPASLLDLATDGLLDVTVTATSGYFILFPYPLSVDYETDPVPDPVPEPSSIVLVMAGLGCLYFIARRKRT